MLPRKHFVTSISQNCHLIWLTVRTDGSVVWWQVSVFNLDFSPLSYMIAGTMPHVSERKLKRKNFKRVSNQLIQTIATLKSSQETQNFIKELLTKTEQVMLAKRLAILFMLKHGYSFRQIEKTLKVTPNTVVRYWKQINRHSFTTITKNIAKEPAKQNFWQELETAFLFGMPPYASGKARWTAMDRAMSVKPIWETIKEYRNARKIHSKKKK